MTCADFNAVAAPLSEAELALKEWGVAYEIQPDGTLVVNRSINISNRGLTRLPDLSRVVVKGDFWCYGNHLTSLDGAPASVGGDFLCAGNQLTSLHGASASVGGSFTCHGNHLTSLHGAPAFVGKNFMCDNNALTSLAGAPAALGGTFFCYDNKLTSLEGAPQKFEKLRSDFGNFDFWDEIPYEVQFSAETRARMEEEARIASYTLLEALVVPRPVTVIKRGRQS